MRRRAFLITLGCTAAGPLRAQQAVMVWLNSYSRNSNVTWWTQSRRRPETRIGPRQDRRRCSPGGNGERHHSARLHARSDARRGLDPGPEDGGCEGRGALRPCPPRAHREGDRCDGQLCRSTSFACGIGRGMARGSAEASGLGALTRALKPLRPPLPSTWRARSRRSGSSANTRRRRLRAQASNVHAAAAEKARPPSPQKSPARNSGARSRRAWGSQKEVGASNLPFVGSQPTTDSGVPAVWRSATD